MPSEDFVIRLATAEDRKALFECFIQCWDDLVGLQPDSPYPARDDYFDDQFVKAMDGDRQFLVMFSGDSIAGFALFTPSGLKPFASFESYGEVLEFWIAPQYRNQTVSYRLASRVFAVMGEHGATALRVDVLRENKRGFDFWQSLGLIARDTVMTMPLRNHLPDLARPTSFFSGFFYALKRGGKPIIQPLRSGGGGGGGG